MLISSCDVNDGELLNAEPRLLLIDAEMRLSFWEKTTLSSDFSQRDRAELIL